MYSSKQFSYFEMGENTLRRSIQCLIYHIDILHTGTWIVGEFLDWFKAKIQAYTNGNPCNNYLKNVIHIFM